MPEKDNPPNSSAQDEPSPSSPNEETVPQKNNNEEISLLCREDPDHPGQYRCRIVPESPKSPPTPPTPEPEPKKTAGRRLTRTPGNVETWTRPDGKTIKVRRILRDGMMVFAPVKDSSSSPTK